MRERVRSRSRFLPLLGSFALTVALLEVALRVTGLPSPETDACWQPTEPFIRPEPDPELGWVYLPGSEIGPATVNARGLRGPVLPERKADGHYRVLFIGDSTAFGLGVPLEESFAARAAAGIAEDRPDPTVEYEIGALPGYSSHHSKVMTRRMLERDPDVVVFYVGGRNDHSRARYYADGEIPGRLARRHAGWHDVATLRLLESVADGFYRKLGRKLRSRAAASRVPPDAFEANMREMVQRVQAAGAVPLVVSPPFSAEMREDHPTVPAYQEALARLAEETGAVRVDIQQAFGQYPDEEVYFPDMFHFNPKGHALAAEEIRRAVDGLRRRGERSEP